jgi:hypothetical protein
VVRVVLVDGRHVSVPGLARWLGRDQASIAYGCRQIIQRQPVPDVLFVVAWQGLDIERFRKPEPIAALMVDDTALSMLRERRRRRPERWWAA